MRLLLAVWLLLFGLADGRAAIVVFFNNTEKEIQATIEHAEGKPRGVNIAAGEIRGVPVAREPVLKATLGGKEQSVRLDPYTPYVFVEERNGPTIVAVELAGKLPKVTDIPAKLDDAKSIAIPLQLYADDANPFKKETWEKALAKRIADAAELFERQLAVTFTIAETGEWKSATDSSDLYAALADFETKAEAKKGLRTIGFIGRAIEGTAFGAYGAMGTPHVVVRYGAPKPDAEKLEVLAHHLALTLGAVKSAENGSAMRSTLGDGQASKVGHRVQLDPLNVLIVRIWAEELAAGRGEKFGDLSDGAKARLLVLYKTVDGINGLLKSDNTQAKEYAEKLLDLGAAAEPMETKPTPKPLPVDPPGETKSIATGDIDAVKSIVAALAAKAEELAKRSTTTEPLRPKGDDLTAEYLKAAATAALKLDEKVRVRAFLLAIGLTLDDSNSLRDKPFAKKLGEGIETADERKARQANFGKPFIRGRRDWCQHFAVSAALTELLGSTAAEFAGLSKELLDMQGTSGFSFADLAADYSGVRFAQWLQEDAKRLEILAKDAKLDDFVPEMKDFVEGLTVAKFKKDFGGTGDDRWKKALGEVRDAIAERPAHKKK